MLQLGRGVGSCKMCFKAERPVRIREERDSDGVKSSKLAQLTPSARAQGLEAAS